MLRFSFTNVLTFASALLFAFAEADSHGVTFLYPSSTAITLNYLDTVNVTYLSPFATPKLYTFCANTTNPKIMQQKLIVNVPAHNASQLVQLNWPDLSSCYFDLRPNSSTGYGANSFTVKINDTARATPLIFGVNQPPAATSSSSPTATASVSPTSTPSTAPSGGNSGTSRGADIGIGVGVAAIAFALIGLAFFFYRRHIRGKKTRGAAIPDHDSQNGLVGQTNDQKKAWHQQSQELGQNSHMLPTYQSTSNQDAHEMLAQTAYEMPADTGAHELSPESSANGPASQNNKQKRFSWEGRERSGV